MKTVTKFSLLLAAGTLAGTSLFAQTTDSTTTTAHNDYVKPFSHSDAFRTWSIGVGAGVLTTWSPFQGNRNLDFTSPDAQLGYNVYIKDQVLPSFGIQLNYLGGKLQGDEGQVTPGSSPISQFDTRMYYAVDLSGNITLANINWYTKKSAIQPYFTFGGGVMSYRPVLHYTDGAVQNFEPKGNGNLNEFYIPLGVGVKLNLSRTVKLDLGYSINFVNSDNIDGYNYGSNYDRFSYAHAGLEFALGSHSKPQLATHNPVSSMRTEYMMSEQMLNNKLQQQQNELAAQKAQNDQLRADLNTTNANLARFTMDSDGDGVPDAFDKCPNTPAGTKVDGSGCPLPQPKNEKIIITEQDKQIVREAIQDLEFDFNKATIRPHSFQSLDRVAGLLVEKGFNLKLAGYTDNIGGKAYNQRLSKDRAEAVKTYLASKGADASKIEAEGYGESHPIASNSTAKGRQLNRRVEFTLF